MKRCLTYFVYNKMNYLKKYKLAINYLLLRSKMMPFGPSRPVTATCDLEPS
jgi:hypothetical protein